MKISQEVRDYATRQEQAAAQPIEVLQSGMDQMSAEFRSRGSELYLSISHHNPANLKAETDNETI